MTHNVPTNTPDNVPNRETGKVDIAALRQRVIGDTHDPRCLTLQDPPPTYDDGTPMGCDCRILHRLDAFAALEEIRLVYRFINSLPSDFRRDAAVYTGWHEDWDKGDWQ